MGFRVSGFGLRILEGSQIVGSPYNMRTQQGTPNIANPRFVVSGGRGGGGVRGCSQGKTRHSSP